MLGLPTLAVYLFSVSDFYYYDKRLKANNLEERKAYFRFTSFRVSVWGQAHCCSGPVAKEHITEGGAEWRKAAHLMESGTKERDRKGQES